MKTRVAISAYLGTPDVQPTNKAAERWSRFEEDIPQGRPTKKCQVNMEVTHGAIYTGIITIEAVLRIRIHFTDPDPAQQ